MATETHKGRKLRVKKGPEWGTLAASVNGYAVVTTVSRDEQAVIGQLRAQIDVIDEEPVNGDRWPAEWYAPGSYQLCPEGHPVAIGGQCRHSYCAAQTG